MTINNEYLLSVCIPLYKCEESIEVLYHELVRNLSVITLDRFEIIFVNDCSPQNDWEIVKKIVQKDPRVRGFSLSKNHGQHPAIFTALGKARGTWVVVMDGDLQDHPDEIPSLYNLAISKGYKKVLARRVNRKDSFLKCFLSRKFYSVLSFMSGAKLDSSIANFGIYHRDVILAVLDMGDRIKYFPAMVNWVGFKTGYLNIEHRTRYAGKTSYNIIKLLKLAFNIIISFSEKPLKAMIWSGFALSFLSFCIALYYLWLAFFHRFTIQGWASLIISIWFSTGLLMFCLGIVGIYLGKIFEQVKKRPGNIIEEFCE